MLSRIHIFCFVCICCFFGSFHLKIGPKFIAPDLCDDENGERKYSVQSFLLSPEEMSLLKPMHIWTKADQSVDGNMFNQLSKAGIVVGSQIEVSNVDVDLLLYNTIKEQIIKKFIDNLGYADAKQSCSILENLFERVKTLINTMHQNPQNFFIVAHDYDLNRNIMVNGSGGVENIDSENNDTCIIDIISKTVIDCVVHQSNGDMLNGQQVQYNSSNPLLYEVISQVLMKYLKPYLENKHSFKDISVCFNEIEKLLSLPETMLQIENKVKSLAVHAVKVNKIELIKALLINNGTVTETEFDILESIRSIMKNDSVDELCVSVRNLICHEPTLMTQILREMQKQTNNLTNESTVIETLRNCIVSAVQLLTDDDIKQITQTPGAYSEEKLNTYLRDTLSLARALGFTDCILNLSNILNNNGDDTIIAQLKEDEKTYELLQRIIIMHKLSERDDIKEKSMELLREDPYSARNDFVLRELLRCSGICTINLVKGNKLRDSNDVPISLIYSGNHLAIEDFFMRKQSKPNGPILIVKNRFQAVIPRESSRDVLTGKCAYTVLDENGIRHFEPLHMFTALKLKNINMFEDRFSSYFENIAKSNLSHDIDIDSILNMGRITTAPLKKEINGIYIAQRYPSPHRLLFNRRSFYL